MTLASFLTSMLVSAFLYALMAIVAGAAAGSRTSHWKRGLVGALVGAAFSVIILGAPISVDGAVSFFLTPLLPSPLDRPPPYFTDILLRIAAAAFVGLAVGLLEVRSVPVMRRCVIVGVVFGVILSLANTVFDSIASFVLALAFPGYGFMSIPIPVVVFGLAPMIVRAAVDVVLAMLAFRFVRRKWGAEPPAPATET